MATRNSPIARGLRAPDFALPRVDGDGPVRFYGLAGGRPVVLLLTDRVTGADEAVAARLTADLGPHADLHRIVRSSDGAPADAFLDVDGQVLGAYGTDGAAPVAVVTDANLRVVATCGLDDVDRAVATIVGAVPEPAGDHHLAVRSAPVLYVPDAISPALRDQLIERFTTHGSVATGVETVVDGARAEATDVRRKRRRDHTVTDPDLLRTLTQHIGSRVFPELTRAFAFAAGGFEGFKIGRYDATDRGHFEAHRDNLSSATAHRRFGLTLNLNDDYDGGELRFPEHGGDRHRPAAGEALVFSGSLLHEVLPVSRGQRFVLLSFLLARR